MERNKIQCGYNRHGSEGIYAVNDTTVIEGLAILVTAICLLYNLRYAVYSPLNNIKIVIGV